jgi:hypothetical protein
MRFLLALLLMAPAFAQQPDLQAKTGDQAAQAPATPADKPADQPAAKPADTTQSPAPSGEQWFTGSVDFGYRWLSDIRGNDSEYRSVLNLGAGPKLTALDFTITDPKHRLFDRLDASAFGWGGDPYNTAHLDARKQGDYDFTFDYRNMAYFDAVPSYANPAAPGGFNEQSFDTHRRSMTVGLDLRPGKRIVPYLVFDRNSGYGNGVEEWVQDSNDEFPVATLLRDSTNNYRGGVRFEYNRFHITLEQGGTTYKEDDQASFNGSEFGDRTSLLLGETLVLNTLSQAYGIRGNSIYSKVLATARPFPWMDLYGQFLYSEPKTTVHFTETATGNFSLINELLFYTGEQTLGTGAANQPHTTGNVGFEIRPLKRMRIVESWMTDRYHDSASPQSLSIRVTGSPVTTVPAPAGSVLNLLDAVNYNQEQVDVLYDLGSKISLRGGYRYIWGDAEVPASPFFAPGGGSESGQLKRNVALAGANFRLSQKLSFNLDYEGGTSDQVYFRTSLNNYQKGRARAKYQLSASLAVQAKFQVLNNQNPASSINLNFESRDSSLSVYWAPAKSKWITVTGEYDRSTVRSSIDYLGLFFTPEISDYRDNAHTASAAVDATIPRLKAKLTMGGSLFLANGSRTTRYYQPLVRFSLPLGKHVFWNTQWQYYGFREDFYVFEGFQTHIFTTGLKLVR